MINKGIYLAKSIPLTELRRKKVKQNDEIIPFVTTFNRKTPELFTEAYQNLNQLILCEKLDNIIRENKIIKSKRQPKNLKQILTRAKFETKDITSS